MFTLTLREPPAAPLDVEGVTPARVNGLSPLEVGKLPVLCGNRREQLGQFFDVTAGPNDTGADLHFAGDTRAVRRVAAGLTGGTVCVDGGVGMHAGAGMSGGSLVVNTSAGDWLGAEMAGGTIEVRGSVGHLAGAAYRGSRRGMTGGTIVVHGGAGDEAGLLMRRGLIAVRGPVGAAAGASMIAGTLVAAGGVGPMAGAGMKRGTLLVGGGEPELPLGFRFSCDYRPAFVGFLLAHLRGLGFPTEVLQAEAYRCFRGDLVTGGKGEVLMPV